MRCCGPWILRWRTITRTGKGTYVVADQPSELVFEDFSAGHLLDKHAPGIEIPAATLAALRRTHAQVEELQELLERMEAETDDAVWTRLDASLHLAIAQVSGNPVFGAVMAEHRRSAQPAVRTPERQGPLGGPPRNRSIGRSWRAIARGSALEAEDAMRSHLDEVRDVIAVSLTTPVPVRVANPGDDRLSRSRRPRRITPTEAPARRPCISGVHPGTPRDLRRVSRGIF